ncbi:porin [Candidatus Methylospira mobilis]|nr:porin [Candidatus Methylospira mobilis]
MLLRALAATGIMGLTMGAAQATGISEAGGLLETVGDLNPNSWKLLSDSGLKIGGWINGGVTYNANGNSMATTQGFNGGGATFGDRADMLQLNQLYVYLQRAVATEGDDWSFGGRFDFNYGTDSIFTQTYGIPTINVTTGNVNPTRGNWDLNIMRGQYYGIALPQAYLESYIPIGNGLNVKLGHFYTPIGYEVVTAPDNFFYTHAYSMQWEPFTHTGALFSYTFDPNWSALGGVITNSGTGGFDGGFNGQWGNWDGIAGLTLSSDDKNTSLYGSGTYGGTSSTPGSGTWSFFSLVLKHNFLDNLHFVLQHDHGFANNVCSVNGSNGRAACNIPVATSQNPQWYSINSELFYDLMEGLGAGMRVEWFRDNDGFRVSAPARVAAGWNPSTGSPGGMYNYVGANYTNSGLLSASYYEVTLGLNWKPLKWLTVRPNARFDWVSSSNLAVGYSPLGYNSSGAPQTTQFLFSTDAIIMF